MPDHPDPALDAVLSDRFRLQAGSWSSPGQERLCYAAQIQFRTAFAVIDILLQQVGNRCTFSKLYSDDSPTAFGQGFLLQKPA